MNTISNLDSLKYYFNTEIILMCGTVLLVLLSLRSKRANDRMPYIFTLFILFAAFGATLASSVTTNQQIFHGMIAYDWFGRFFKTIIIATAFVTVILADKSKDIARMPHAEFYGFLIAATLGLCVMAVANNLLMVYLGVEMASIISYVMTGYITFSKRSEEAGLKYIFYGGMASGVMIFGLSLLYGLTGHLDLIGLREYLMTNPTDRLVLFITFIFVLTGLGYKMAVAPFHMWSPDVYEGAPISVTAFLSVASKAAAFAVTVRFFKVGFIDEEAGLWLPLKALNWQMLVAVMAAITMTIGNLVALQQNNIKRFLAYSSVAHAGNMLMGVAAQSQQGVEGITFYFMIYFFMNLGAFLVAILISNQFGSEEMTDYKGLAKRNTFGFLVAMCMSIFMLSLAGIPPFAGFAAKWYVFGAVIKAGPGLLWLAVVGVINSVVSLFYYVRLVKYMTFDEPADATVVLPNSKRFTVLMVGFAVATLVLGIAFGPLADWAIVSAKLFS